MPAKASKIGTNETIEYEWDHRNRLTGVTHKDGGAVTKKVAYIYDVFNRKIGKKIDTNGDGAFERHEWFAYDGDQIALVFADLDGDGPGASSLTNRYMYGPAVDQVLADEQLNPDGTLANLYWPLADHEGTIRDIAQRDSTTGAVTIVNHLFFDSFGNLASETNPAVDHLFSFTGRIWDADALLYDYRARWYDPAIGRFISEDPIGLLGGDTNFNRYVGNDPVNSTDPSGLISDEDIAFRRENPHPTRVPPEDLWPFVEVADVGTGLTPGVSDVRDWTEFTTGHDIVRRRPLTGWGRFWTGVGLATPVVGAAVYRRFSGLFFKVVDEAPEVTRLNKLREIEAKRAMENACPPPAAPSNFPKGFDPTKGFATFDEFKAAFGSAGKRQAWHHIVEQTINSGKFSAEMLHNPANLIKLPHGAGTFHAKISGYYSSKQAFTGGLTVREWLSTKSFMEQFEFGIQTIKDFGGGRYLPSGL